MKKIILFIKNVLLWVLSVLYTLTLYPLGLVLYYLSKLVRFLAFKMILAPGSARNELAGFWSVYKSIDDALYDWSIKK